MLITKGMGTIIYNKKENIYTPGAQHSNNIGGHDNPDDERSRKYSPDEETGTELDR